MSHCFRNDLEEFLDEGFCVAREPDTGKIRAIFSHRDRFKIPEIHKILFGEKVDYQIKIHVEETDGE